MVSNSQEAHELANKFYEDSAARHEIFITIIRRPELLARDQPGNFYSNAAEMAVTELCKMLMTVLDEYLELADQVFAEDEDTDDSTDPLEAPKDSELEAVVKALRTLYAYTAKVGGPISQQEVSLEYGRYRYIMEPGYGGCFRIEDMEQDND